MNYKTKAYFANRLSELLKERGESQFDLARMMNVAQSSVSAWCTGAKMPRMDKIEWLSHHFGVSVSSLIEGATNSSPVIPDAFPYNPTKRIPILGRISAGMPLYAEQNIEGYTYVDMPDDGEYFGLIVKGDSMDAAGIKNGYTLIVRRQEDVENGDIAVVLVNGEDATVKRFFRSDNMVTLMPQSMNPAHLPQMYNIEQTEILIQGKVIEVKFKP